MPSDRRTFLRRAAALSLLGPVGAAWSCAPRDGESVVDDADGAAAPHRPLARPTVVPGPGEEVHVLAPTADLPMAYLSREEMRVYVDSSHRDWAERRLAAYVSVTTGLWRIPRPEDAPGVPIVPGDALREFEVVDLGQWDPGTAPAEGDVRLRLGAPVTVGMELSCVPILSDGAWLSAEPLVVTRLDGAQGDGGREDFLSVAMGTRHSDRACRDTGEAVRILTWAVPGAPVSPGPPTP